MPVPPLIDFVAGGINSSCNIITARGRFNSYLDTGHCTIVNYPDRVRIARYTAGIVSFEHEEMFGLYRALLPLVSDEAARRLIYDYLAPLLLWCSPALQWLDSYVAAMHGWPIRLPSIGGDFVVMPSLAAPRVPPAVASPFLSPEALALHAVFIWHEQSLIHKVPPVPLRMLRGGYGITRVPHAGDELCTGPSQSRPCVAWPPQRVRSVRNVCASCRICCEYYQILLCENHSASGPNSPPADSDGKPTA